MMLDAITLDLGCVSAPAFILPDASGLAPLELPSALVSDTPLPADGASREPLPDAVRRFEAAMGAGEAISDAVPVSRLRAVVVPHEEKRQVVVDTVDPRVDATAQKVVETVDSRVVVMTRRDAIVPENPVNSVDPVVKDAPQVVVDVQKPDTPSPKVDVVTGKETPTVVTETVDSREVAEARRVITETVDSRGVMEAWRDAIAPDNSVNTVNPVVKDAPQVVVDVQKPDAPRPKVDAVIAKEIPVVVTETVDSRRVVMTQRVITETVDLRGVVSETRRDAIVLENSANPVNPVIKDAPQATVGVQKPDAPRLKIDAATAKAPSAVITETVDQRGTVDSRVVVMTQGDTIVPENPVNSVNPVVKDAPQAVADVLKPDAPRHKVDAVTAKAPSAVAADTVDYSEVVETRRVIAETVDLRGVVSETRRDATVLDNPVKPVDPVVKDAPRVVADVAKPAAPSLKADVVTAKAPSAVITETVDQREVAETRRVITETVDSRGAMEARRDAIAPENPVNPVNPVVKDAPQIVVDVQKPDTPNPKVEAIIGKVIPAAVTEAIDSRETVDSLGVVNTQRDVTAPENPVNSVNPVVKDAPQAVADVPKSDAPSPKADVSTGKEVPAVVTETVDQRGVVMTRKDTPQAIVDVQRPDAPSPKVDVVTGKVIPTVVTEAVDSRGVAETRRDKVSPDNSVKPVVKDAPDAADQRKVAETVVIVPVSTDAPAPQAAQATPDVSAVSAATARTESIVETVNQIVEAVAGQILVTPGIAHGEGEVKIMLKPTVLDGSEITMSSKGGTLTVNIAPATPDAAAAAAAALPRLETALAEHAPAFHHVTVALATKKGSRNEAV